MGVLRVCGPVVHSLLDTWTLRPTMKELVSKKTPCHTTNTTPPREENIRHALLGEKINRQQESGGEVLCCPRILRTVLLI